jgi:anti-sigma regulatory factor (Ser/Thr protein kinase)
MLARAYVRPRSVGVTVGDVSQVGEARRLAARICGDAHFDETLAGQVAIVTTELANNLLRHAGGGEVLVRRLNGDPDGVEVIALDRGPGIADVARALQDGHSSRGSQGTGMGAIRRLSSLFELFTGPGGTAVLARFWPGAPAAELEHGAVSLPMPGETECGDAWSLERAGDAVRLLVVDGLGHGPQAHEAARAVCDSVGPARSAGPAAALEDAHLAARPTRGAAAALLEVQSGSAEVRFAGVGNVSGLAAGVGSQSLVSINGTLGQGVVKPREFSYKVSPGALLILSSDGLATRWSLDAYPGLAARHPGLVAAVLYRDFWRKRDDVTVLAARLGAR